MVHYYERNNMGLREFIASLLLGLLSVVLPIAIFIGMVAACVSVARWWTDKRGE